MARRSIGGATVRPSRSAPGRRRLPDATTFLRHPTGDSRTSALGGGLRDFSALFLTPRANPPLAHHERKGVPPRERVVQRETYHFGLGLATRSHDLLGGEARAGLSGQA